MAARCDKPGDTVRKTGIFATAGPTKGRPAVSARRHVGAASQAPVKSGRRLDRFLMTVNRAGELIVDTGTIIVGPAIGTNTTGQESEGPSCITSAASHA